MKDKEPSDDKLLTTFYYMNQFGNIREFPQAVGVARELQKAETIFLKEIVKIFEKHGIRYWLDGGTLLGSIRHGGFIPWDDDIDIGVMREDYDKLQEIFGEAFSSDSNFYFNDHWIFDSVSCTCHKGYIFYSFSNSLFVDI